MQVDEDIGLAVGHLRGGHEREHARVVDQYVGFEAPAVEKGEHLVGRVRSRQVAVEGRGLHAVVRGRVGGGLFEGLALVGDHHEVAAPSGQRPREAKADAAARSGHDGEPPLEVLSTACHSCALCRRSRAGCAEAGRRNACGRPSRANTSWRCNSSRGRSRS